jgi:NAD(P)-dependent dehydrogenase (short-subunit alcohol dehydrogenase family)
VTQRTALVTGGGSGLGKAICERFARDGRAVGVLDIDSRGAAAVARAITGAGGKAMALSADIADRRQIAAAVEKLQKAFGAVGILVNNAAVENFRAFAQIEDECWDKLINTNLKGAFIVTQAVLPDMLAMQWGRIVNISALGAQTGAPNMAHYAASKGGIIAMTRSLAIELGPKGITVNSVSPGFIDTPMSRRAIDGGLFPVPYQQIVAGYPIPRLGRPEDIACACAFFASEDAGYVTAQVLGVNGGAAV